MRLTIPKASTASQQVFYYATDAESAKKLRTVMEHFRDQTPRGKFVLEYPEVATVQ